MTPSSPNDATTTAEKPYDAVATQRRIREQISRETEGMNFEELQPYLVNHIAVPFRPATQPAEQPHSAPV